MSGFKIGDTDNLLAGITAKIKISQLQQAAPKTENLDGNRERAVKAAEQFEGILVQQMMKSMWEAVPKGGLLSGSNEEQLYQEMLQKEISNHIAEHQSFGIKDMVIKDLEKKGEI